MTVHCKVRVLHRRPVIDLQDIQQRSTCKSFRLPTLIPFSPVAATIFRVSNCRAVTAWSYSKVSNAPPVRTSHTCAYKACSTPEKTEVLERLTRMVLSKLPLTMWSSSNWRQVTGPPCPVSVLWGCPVRTTSPSGQLVLRTRIGYLLSHIRTAPSPLPLTRAYPQNWTAPTKSW